MGLGVDGHLPVERRTLFDDHIQSCPSCKRTFELEVVAKSLVRLFVPRATTPPTVRNATLTSLAMEADRRTRAWPVRFFGSIPVPAYGFAIAAILLVYVFFPAPDSPSDSLIRHGDRNDIIQQATLNFSLFREGKL